MGIFKNKGAPVFTLTSYVSKSQKKKQAKAIASFYLLCTLLFPIFEIAESDGKVDWNAMILVMAIVMTFILLLLFFLFKTVKKHNIRFYEKFLHFNQGKHGYRVPYSCISSVNAAPIYDTLDYDYSGTLVDVDILLNEDTFVTTIPLLDNLSQNSIIIRDKRHLTISGVPADEKPVDKINDIIAK
jgi:hypothetical protein